MTGPGPDKRKSMMVYESVSVPINHRDASNSSAGPWKNPPTPIPVPATGQRIQRPLRSDNNQFPWLRNQPASGPASVEQPRRAHDSPYVYKNTLESRGCHPGNPNVRKTVLAQPPVDSTIGAQSHARKRQKLNTCISSTMSSAGASSSHTRGPPPRSSAFEPDVQVIEPPHSTNKRSNPLPNDAEIIELGTSSDDLGERVPRAISPSPDPLLLGRKRPHDFETRPTTYNSSNKGKGRAKEPLEFVEGSEEEEDAIQEFTPPPAMPRPSYAGKSPTIPPNIVPERRKVFESAPASAPAAVRRPIQEGVRSVDLTVVGKMKRKDEGTLGQGMSDRLGISSSNFTNSAREREKTQTLPLDAWCLGHHLFRHSESAPLKLVYEVGLQRIRITLVSREKIEFKLDRDVHSAMIVNDVDQPLKEDIVVQFITIPTPAWGRTERKYKGFKAGGERGRAALTFRFSIAKDRGLCATSYQKFVTGIRKAFQPSAIETIKPSIGANIWTYAINHADMFERTMSSRKEDLSESIPDELSSLRRSVTPCSSTSVKAGPGPLPNGDSGSSMFHRRSVRQSAMRSARASPPPPPAQDPDEIVLMYPPTGTGALSITYGDLRRLKPEEYLNDTLIEFGLKLWLNDLREKDPGLAEQIHVFSSFFYKKLNNRKNPDEGYKSVRKWTSKVPFFTKKYIIIPINENVHWYLAIIYEPGHTLEPPLPLLQSQLSKARVTRKRKKNQERTQARSETRTEVSLERLNPAHPTEKEPEVDTSSVEATRATTPSTMDNEEMDDIAITDFDRSCSITAAELTSSEFQARDSSPNLVHPPSDGMDVDVNTSVTDVVPIYEVTEVTEPSTPKSSPGIPVSQFYGSAHETGDVQPIVTEDNEDSGEDQQQEAEVDDMLAVTQSPTGDIPPQTYIFTLDSLGTRHPQAIKVLRQYLKSEAKDKCNFDEVREAVGKQVQVPVQPNTWDCGIYLLHFVKAFMSDPSEFVGQILSTRGTMPSLERKKMWQDHEVPQFRDYLQSRILQLSEVWQAEKTVREEEANRRRSKDAQEVEALSSDGEVDIVEDIPIVKATPGPKQKQPAARLRG